MIHELRIQNFAIIDQLELEFANSLIVFTGETGAGKSIIIDAVETLLGARADATQVRAGSERAIVEATFKIPPHIQPAVQALLEAEGLLDDPEIIVLGREIRLNGRSTARINGRSVSLGLLKTLGEFLVDVHGQSEHLSLLRVPHHLELLDAYANTNSEFSAYTATYQRLHALRRELHQLREIDNEAARRIDTLQYQINEIETAHLKPGEEEKLREERTRLANAEGLASAAQEAIRVLDEGSPETQSVLDSLGQAVRQVSTLARLDTSQADHDAQLLAIHESLSELVRDLQDYLENIEFNPKRLDQVEERLNLILTLKRKYGKARNSSIDEVIEYAAQARQQLEQISHASERIEALEAEEQELLAHLSRQGQALSRARHAASANLENDLEAELESLSMAGARFKVFFQSKPDPHGVLLDDGSRVAFDATGLEQVEFLVAPNPGEGLKPLVKIASGGETSRLMLGIKNVLARADRVPTLIFDEIDQGIGGRVGSVVGRKLWELGRQHQVLCVTHLPQLAAFGEQHLHVEKSIYEGRTTTQVKALQNEARLRELAQMIGEVSPGTLHSAQELLKLAQV
ncbi:MAG: DNA repair protein RecN [Anaerolineales bacterium]|jgi:DNA repair protein RecN (Recombination protein N)|nr:DNA repair protein RecN [Anaerolineales bacterium]